MLIGVTEFVIPVACLLPCSENFGFAVAMAQDKQQSSESGWFFRSLFQREARTSGWEALDGLRGLFCVLVMVYHCVSYLSAWMPNREMRDFMKRPELSFLMMGPFYVE